MKLNKKEVMFLIFYTVALIFAFIYIKDLLNIIGTIIRWFMPFIIGLGMAFVLNVLVNLIENKWLKKWQLSNKSKRCISLILSLGIIIGFLIFLMVLLIPSLKDAIVIFVNNLPVYTDALKGFLEKLNIDANIINKWVEIVKSFGDYASDFIKNNSDTLIDATLGVATNVVNTLLNWFIALVFAIYYLAQKEKITTQFNKILDAYLPKKYIEKINDIGKLSNKIFSSYVSGQCLEALIFGIMCFFGMIILRLPFAPSISVLIGTTALIPIFGAFLGVIVGAILIFAINPLQALIFIIFIIVLQQIEGNLIYPVLVGKSVNLPGIWVFVAVTVGASIAGVLGMILSVPVASLLYSILATNVNYKLKQK